jgi:hypothetical protein
MQYVVLQDSKKRALVAGATACRARMRGCEVDHVSESDQSPSRYRIIAKILGITGIAALTLSLLSYFLWFTGGTVSDDSAKWGTFGDYVSGIGGTIIALATLIAVAYALDLQDRELSSTRKALEGQLFDTRFFQLLQRFTAVSDQVRSVAQDGRPLRGRDAIARIYETMRSSFPVGAHDNILTTITDHHRLFYKPNEQSLGPYFRTLYHVFKLIHRQRYLSRQEKIDYANIARSQLSRYELALLFYNGLTPYGEKFKPLIERYGILKHLDQFDLPDAAHKTNAQLYVPTAFMSQEEREDAAEA